MTFHKTNLTKQKTESYFTRRINRAENKMTFQMTNQQKIKHSNTSQTGKGRYQLSAHQRSMWT